MKFGSLFTGVGGFDLGLERADFECAWQVERDPHCLEVLAEHYPNVERYTDVRTVGKHNLEPVELICGGFPCQDLSVAGKRAGFAGERSSLWFEFERIIDELRPKWVIVENVPGLLSSRNGADFAIILKALDDRGYGVAWRVLDSQNFGVAQRRRRVFIVASLGNASCAEVLFESEGVPGDTETGRKAWEEVAYTLRANHSHSGDKGDGGINTTLITSTLRGFGHGWQGQHSDTNAVLVPLVGVRRLTPTECERLQGFPDGWTAGQSDTQRYKQMGNAVTVNVIEWIGNRIAKQGAR